MCSPGTCRKIPTHRAQPRRDGKMHLSASSGSTDRGSTAKKPGAGNPPGSAARTCRRRSKCGRSRPADRHKPAALPRLRFQTACQQACPTEALIFGDINDAGAWATALKNRQPWAAIDYGVLTEYNTQPRTSYLERLENPNPALAAEKPGGRA